MEGHLFNPGLRCWVVEKRLEMLTLSMQVSVVGFAMKTLLYMQEYATDEAHVLSRMGIRQTMHPPTYLAWFDSRGTT